MAPKTSSDADARRVRRCRVCNSKDLTLVLDLGETPLANSYLERPTDPERRFPLRLLFCNDCSLVQLSHIVRPDLMFRDYAYRSSSSATVREHVRELAEYLHANFLTSSKDLVVEIGSNDGSLLGAFKGLGSRVLGVDPAKNLARIANERGLETIPEFFDASMAHQIRQTRGPARIIIGNNVFAHVDDLHDLMGGVAALLDEGGVFSIEVPYLGDLNQNVEYDTVYHEHLSYFAVHPIETLFAQFQMGLLSVTRLEIHGGTIRVIGTKSKKRIPRSPFIDLERKCGLDRLETFRDLGYRVEYQKSYLKYTLDKIKSEGRAIVGYGAPAKSNTLLNACGIGTETLDYVIDTTPEKIGKYTPGTHIPIYETERFRRDQPPYALMLAWNYEKEIILKERDYTGQFIIPIPYPRILSKNPGQ